jgi:hypothetical protein
MSGNSPLHEPEANVADSNKDNKEAVESTPEVINPNPSPAVGPTVVSALAVQASVDPLAMRQALEKMRPKFQIITQQQFMLIRLDVPIMSMDVLKRLDEIEPYRDKIAQLPFVNHDYIANLEPGALALLEIDSQCTVAVKLPPEVMETYREASVLRDEIREEALILVRRKLLPRGSLDAVAGDRGYRNTAVELTALGNLLRDHWPNIVGKSAITIDEVNRCNVLAHILFRNADDRLERAAIPAQLAFQRQQAYTWLMLAWEELRRCMNFLEPVEVVDKLFPSLFHGRGGRKAGSSVTEEPAPAVPATPVSPEADLEARIAAELLPGATAATPSVTDPVARAEAAVQAAGTTAKASKNPFTS